MNLLAKLSELVAPAGKEDKVRELLANEFINAGLNVEIDESGNVIGYKEITDKPIILSAHMDEIGFIVKYIDEDGFIRIVPLGGFLPEYLLSKKVIIYGKEEIYGVVQRSYLEDWDNDKERALKFKDLFIQTTLSKEELEKKIHPGMVGGVLQTPYLTENYIIGKALDDRIGVYILAQLAKNLPRNVILIGSTEEEVSHYGKGAANAVWKLNPKLFIAIDVGEANDYPGGEKYTKINGGPEITVTEIKGIGNVVKNKYIEHINTIALENNIPIQYRITVDSATEASNIFHLKGGIPSLAICTPIRYIHTFNEYASKKDIDYTIKLLDLLIHSNI